MRICRKSDDDESKGHTIKMPYSNLDQQRLGGLGIYPSDADDL